MRFLLALILTALGGCSNQTAAPPVQASSARAEPLDPIRETMDKYIRGLLDVPSTYSFVSSETVPMDEDAEPADLLFASTVFQAKDKLGAPFNATAGAFLSSDGALVRGLGSVSWSSKDDRARLEDELLSDDAMLFVRKHYFKRSTAALAETPGLPVRYQTDIDRVLESESLLQFKMRSDAFKAVLEMDTELQAIIQRLEAR